MKKFLIIFIIFFISQSVFSKDYMYTCQKLEDVPSCSNSCKKHDDNGTLEFDVDKEKNLVLISVYSNGKLSGNINLENCKIVDKKNWICEDPPISKHVMTKGNYYQTMVVNGNRLISNTCTKYSLF